MVAPPPRAPTQHTQLEKKWATRKSQLPRSQGYKNERVQTAACHPRQGQPKRSREDIPRYQAYGQRRKGHHSACSG
eukprot:scaffold132201_cov29-Tisochrysis_lutea.AAC.3